MYLALALFAALAAADPAPPSPLETTRRVLDGARAIIEERWPHDRKLAALHRLLVDFLDTDAMGRVALGDQWEDFEAAQREEFLRLFRELFQRTYVEKLLLFERPDFAFDGEAIDGAAARVSTRILTPKDAFAVTYGLRLEAGRWRAIDIQIEDLSLTRHFARQLAHLLQSSSPAALLERMRRKYAPREPRDEDRP